ncbi:MAG TPA: 2-hydroxyacid dehydrogenase, partial [Myxococcaceae bacterium]|nr:2-hydroxyacid dehydrogenase [Myxococcaceae bacterium]
IAVTRVPDYSPEAVAEHAVALLLTLNRKTHRAYARVRELNFSLEGLVGFNLCGKAVGIVGTGKIGAAAARIFLGFGCRVIAWDVVPSPSLVEAGVTYVELDALLAQSDVVSLHLPLSPQTRHLIDGDAVGRMKRGAVLINTGRGGLVDTQALLEGLKSGKLGGAGLDVYEAEAGVFFNDLSTRGLEDDALARLLTLPNVLITSHQAFLTREALGTIARTTLEAVSAFERGEPLVHRVRPDPVPIAPPRP